jgi:hypothetical protein
MGDNTIVWSPYKELIAHDHRWPSLQCCRACMGIVQSTANVVAEIIFSDMSETLCLGGRAWLSPLALSEPFRSKPASLHIKPASRSKTKNDFAPHVRWESVYIAVSADVPQLVRCHRSSTMSALRAGVVALLHANVRLEGGISIAT